MYGIGYGLWNVGVHISVLALCTHAPSASVREGRLHKARELWHCSRYPYREGLKGGLDITLADRV